MSTYGTGNGVTPPEAFEASPRWPPGAEIVVIDGGNHARFGHDPQSGDGVATIDREEQLQQAAETVLAFLRGIR